MALESSLTTKALRTLLSLVSYFFPAENGVTSVFALRFLIRSGVPSTDKLLKGGMCCKESGQTSPILSALMDNWFEAEQMTLLFCLSLFRHLVKLLLRLVIIPKSKPNKNFKLVEFQIYSAHAVIQNALHKSLTSRN